MLTSDASRVSANFMLAAPIHVGIEAIGLLLGDPMIVKSGLLAGSCVEIGKFALNIAEKKIDFKSQMDTSEISILMDIKKIQNAKKC